MAIDEAEFKQRKQRAEDAQRECDKAAGQLEILTERLRTEFGCSSLAAAQREVKRLAKEAAAAERDYDKAAAEFEEAWGDRAEN